VGGITCADKVESCRAGNQATTNRQTKGEASTVASDNRRAPRPRGMSSRDGVSVREREREKDETIKRDQTVVQKVGEFITKVIH